MFLALPDIIIAIRQLYSTPEIVTELLEQGRHRPGQLRMATDIKMATNVDCIDVIYIYINDICSSWLPTLPDEYQGSKGNFLQIFNKNILLQ